MTGSGILLEFLIVMGFYIAFDRAAFWYMGNVFSQVTGRISDLKYRNQLTFRLGLAGIGCGLAAYSRATSNGIAGFVGYIVLLACVAWLVGKFIGKFLRVRRS